MRYVVVRSIPLSKDTREAWQAAGFEIWKRKRPLNDLAKEVALGETSVINLGRVDLPDFRIDIYNEIETIRAISSPGRLRQNLNDFIPPDTIKGPHWHKNMGYGGRDKYKCEDGCTYAKGMSSDVQKHIPGPEFRVISVGNLVVQAHRKDHVDDDNYEGNFSFDWNWVGVDGIRSGGIIPLIKSAVEKTPLGNSSIIGWDIIIGSDKPYIIEANTSPGVNLATASRIMNAIKENN